MEYKKSLDDEIDWKIIDQLHAATVNFSNASLELKKMLVVMIGIAIPALVKLAGDRLDTSLFSTLYVITFAFWFLDSFTYFYQEKLREKMDKLFRDIKMRNQNKDSKEQVEKEDFTLEHGRSNRDRIVRSIFNRSIALYVVIITINSLSFVLFLNKVIQ